mmetsp:Transcript_20810/g.36716  ORF Transcript_20810/g.36716 Transcript_20810/m.36716 type:complete len:703 (+) Transcript_20810:43-2151(+)
MGAADGTAEAATESNPNTNGITSNSNVNVEHHSNGTSNNRAIPTRDDYSTYHEQPESAAPGAVAGFPGGSQPWGHPRHPAAYGRHWQQGSQHGSQQGSWQQGSQQGDTQCHQEADRERHPAAEFEQRDSEVSALQELLRKAQQEVSWLRGKKDKLEEDSEWWKRKCRQLEASGYNAWKDVCVSSPLTEFREQIGKPDAEGWHWRHYKTSCPCCRRPLDIDLQDASADTDPWAVETPWAEEIDGADGTQENPGDFSTGGSDQHKEASSERYAYCCAIWGANAGYALGAAVLGSRLRELGAGQNGGPDLVLLHTDDLPMNYLKLLASVWTLQEVDYIDGVEALYNMRGTNFDGVFTKLQAWSLVQYDKVLLLDLDIIPLRPLDSLFELEAPAALVRGQSELNHGEETDGRRFFTGEDCEGNAWGQSGGINAGVILLKPCRDLFRRMLREVTCPSHPCHISGNGPEQDYLTRFFGADRSMPWRHIDVGWNYQLHHVPFALESAIEWRRYLTSRESWQSDVKDKLPRRLAMAQEDIGIVHFSGDFKLWHMLIPPPISSQSPVSSQEGTGHDASSDRVFAEKLIGEFGSYPLWVSRDASAEAYAEYGCMKTDEGQIMLLPDCKEDITSLVDMGSSRMREVSLLATTTWRECFERLQAKQPAILQELSAAQVPGNLEVGARVEVQWILGSPGSETGDPSSKRWLAGRV